MVSAARCSEFDLRKSRTVHDQVNTPAVLAGTPGLGFLREDSTIPASQRFRLGCFQYFLAGIVLHG